MTHLSVFPVLDCYGNSTKKCIIYVGHNINEEGIGWVGGLKFISSIRGFILVPFKEDLNSKDNQDGVTQVLPGVKRSTGCPSPVKNRREGELGVREGGKGGKRACSSQILALAEQEGMGYLSLGRTALP